MPHGVSARFPRGLNLSAEASNSSGSTRRRILFNTLPHATANLDRIIDFNVAADTIKLENLFFKALTKMGVLAPGAFHIGSAVHDADDRIVYNSATGALSYNSDGTGGIAAVQFAKLATGLALTNADCVVV